ncbi:transposase [Ruegeria conchae]|uniref:Transposase IS200 family protein n=1 Tax=Ruegeria conchae TaxID=981384 RepID=A0A497Z8V2_9RHOB|nr:transposase [Ruegeria conchae]RLK02614.1 hypothetical protein CLV75_3166 [Ruegeria conchae]
MSDYRRVRIPGAKYFFTVSLADRSSDLLVREVVHLRAAFAVTQRERPFWCDAIVVLPDHLHAVWTLPPGDADYLTRLGGLGGKFGES